MPALADEVEVDLADRERTRKRSILLIVGVLATIGVLTVGMIVLAAWSVIWLVGKLT